MRDFIDALRCALGLAPLYAAERDAPQLEIFESPFDDTADEWFVGGGVGETLSMAERNSRSAAIARRRQHV